MTRLRGTQPVVDEDHGSMLMGGDGILGFLEALHELKREIEERAPGYFEARPLRCRAAAGDVLELPDADRAAESWKEGAPCPVGPDGRGTRVRLVDFCDWVGAAYEMSLVPARDPGEMNAIDRLFDQRVAWFWPRACGSAESMAGAPREETQPEQERWRRLLETVYRDQEAKREERDRRIAQLPVRLTRHTVHRDGVPFSYFAAGLGGVPVVLVNALGQGLRYWDRLVDCLIPHHRVILWELRGTTTPAPFGIDDQVSDLEAILQQESIQKCHLVGWCSGPKVALRFHRRHPDRVASLVFLNSTFKCSGSPPESTTEYENNMESLCRIVVERPAMAGPLMRALQTTLKVAEIDLVGSGSEECAQEVLGCINGDLRDEVLGPFRNESTTANYAHQFIDFVSYDALADAASVNVPMLVIASEYDRVSAPAMSRAAAAVFNHSRCFQVRGASHYCIYDRPELIAGLMEAFFTDETRLPGTPGGMVDIV